jgi:hypothetical protein
MSLFDAMPLDDSSCGEPNRSLHRRKQKRQRHICCDETQTNRRQESEDDYQRFHAHVHYARGMDTLCIALPNEPAL